MRCLCCVTDAKTGSLSHSVISDLWLRQPKWHSLSGNANRADRNLDTDTGFSNWREVTKAEVRTPALADVQPGTSRAALCDVNGDVSRTGLTARTLHLRGPAHSLCGETSAFGTCRCAHSPNTSQSYRA